MERKGEEGGKNVGERVEEISGRAEGEEAELQQSPVDKKGKHHTSERFGETFH